MSHCLPYCRRSVILTCRFTQIQWPIQSAPEGQRHTQWNDTWEIKQNQWISLFSPTEQLALVTWARCSTRWHIFTSTSQQIVLQSCPDAYNSSQQRSWIFFQSSWRRGVTWCIIYEWDWREVNNFFRLFPFAVLPPLNSDLYIFMISRYMYSVNTLPC